MNSNPENPEFEKQPDSPQSLGGKARSDSLSKKQKIEIASKAAKARWGFPRALYEDKPIVIGKAEIPCAVLEGDIRVLSERAVTKALGGKRGGAHWLRMKEQEKDGAELPVYLSAKNLSPFIDNDLRMALKPIVYLSKHGGPKTYGLRAELLPKICNVFLKARDVEGGLHWRQRDLAKQAEILMRGLAEIGIIALVDEATGRQADRARDALATILEEFIAKELRVWAQTFPLEFYTEIARLKGWKDLDLAKGKRPGVIGHYTNNLVYQRLAPGVLAELRQKNPVVDGRRKHKHFQWLSEDVGHPELRGHLKVVLRMMGKSVTWEQFLGYMDLFYPIIETTELGFETEVRT